MAGIPYFKPAHHAVRLCCNICGVEFAREELLSERSRAGYSAEQQGEYLFCRPHQPIAAELGQRATAFAAQKRANCEREISAELPDLMAEWVVELTGDIPGASPSPPQNRATKAPRHRPGSIPDPAAPLTNGR